MPSEEKIFHVQLAGIVIEISSIYKDIFTLCHSYLTSGPAAFSISTTHEDITFEQKRPLCQDEPESIAPRRLYDGYMETLAVLRKIAELIPNHDAMLFHGSALALDGDGILFTAKSGVGKSTHARLWRERFGKRVQMVNDDKPLIKITDKGPFLCGTPWDGKHRLNQNISVPLKAVCLLHRSEENHIEAVSSREAWPLLMQQVYLPRNPVAVAKTLTLLDSLMKNTSLYSLGCNTEPEAVLTAYEGIWKG